METTHHSLSRPDCNTTAGVPHFTLRTAVSAIPFVSDLCGVDVQWFQDNSSQDLPNSEEFVSVNDFELPRRHQEIHGTSLSSSGSPEKFLFYSGRIVPIELPYLAPQQRIDDCYVISHPSLRTLWSAFITSPKFSAWGTPVPSRLLQEALVIFVFKEISPFRSFGKWEKCCVYSVPLFLTALKAIHEKNWKCLDP